MKRVNFKYLTIGNGLASFLERKQLELSAGFIVTDIERTLSTLSFEFPPASLRSIKHSLSKYLNCLLKDNVIRLTVNLETKSWALTYYPLSEDKETINCEVVTA